MIRTWGPEGEQIAQEIIDMDRGDYFYPLLRLDDHWEHLRCVHIRAIITIADEIVFPGCVVENPPLYVGLFTKDGCEHGFNLRLPDCVERNLALMRLKTGLLISPFFPLKYKSELRDSQGMRIEGFFGYEQDVSDYLEQKHGVSLRIRDVVRVVSLNSDDRYIWGDDPVRRQPQIGDIGRIQNIYDPEDHTAPIVVECIQEDDTPFYGGPTVWLAEFAQDELELVERRT